MEGYMILNLESVSWNHCFIHLNLLTGLLSNKAIFCNRKSFSQNFLRDIKDRDQRYFLLCYSQNRKILLSFYISQHIVGYDAITKKPNNHWLHNSSRKRGWFISFWRQGLLCFGLSSCVCIPHSEFWVLGGLQGFSHYCHSREERGWIPWWDVFNSETTKVITSALFHCSEPVSWPLSNGKEAVTCGESIDILVSLCLLSPFIKLVAANEYTGDPCSQARE